MDTVNEQGMKTNLWVNSVLGLSCFLFCNCATITKDESQPVSFSSEPQGAEVAINSVPGGTTPTTIMVKRKMGTTMVNISKKGYHPETFPLDKSLAAMTFGNIIFGGLIGLGVDVATGKAADYQESVHVNLRPLAGGVDDLGKEPKEGEKNQSERKESVDFKRRLMKRYSDGEISEDEYLKMLETNQDN